MNGEQLQVPPLPPPPPGMTSGTSDFDLTQLKSANLMGINAGSSELGGLLSPRKAAGFLQRMQQEVAQNPQLLNSGANTAQPQVRMGSSGTFPTAQQQALNMTIPAVPSVPQPFGPPAVPMGGDPRNFHDPQSILDKTVTSLQPVSMAIPNIPQMPEMPNPAILNPQNPALFASNLNPSAQGPGGVPGGPPVPGVPGARQTSPTLFTKPKSLTLNSTPANLGSMMNMNSKSVVAQGSAEKQVPSPPLAPVFQTETTTSRHLPSSSPVPNGVNQPAQIPAQIPATQPLQSALYDAQRPPAGGGVIPSTGGAGKAGVGIIFDEDRSKGVPRVFVRAVLDGSPAERSQRVRKGDLLVMLDDEEVYGAGLDKLAEKIPGVAGSQVRLGFSNRDGSFVQVTLIRETQLGGGSLPVEQQALARLAAEEGSVSPPPQHPRLMPTPPLDDSQEADWNGVRIPSPPPSVHFSSPQGPSNPSSSRPKSILRRGELENPQPVYPRILNSKQPSAMASDGSSYSNGGRRTPSPPPSLQQNSRPMSINPRPQVFQSDFGSDNVQTLLHSRAAVASPRFGGAMRSSSPPLHRQINVPETPTPNATGPVATSQRSPPELDYALREMRRHHPELTPAEQRVDRNIVVPETPSSGTSFTAKPTERGPMVAEHGQPPRLSGPQGGRAARDHSPSSRVVHMPAMPTQTQKTPSHHQIQLPNPYTTPEPTVKPLISLNSVPRVSPSQDLITSGPPPVPARRSPIPQMDTLPAAGFTADMFEGADRPSILDELSVVEDDASFLDDKTIGASNISSRPDTSMEELKNLNLHAVSAPPWETPAKEQSMAGSLSIERTDSGPGTFV